MSIYISLSSTPFALSLAQLAELNQAAKKNFGDDCDDAMIQPVYEVLSIEPLIEKFFLTLEGEVGHSFMTRAKNFAEDAGKIVEECVEMTMREDTLSDERDTHFYFGPDQAQLNDYRAKCMIQRGLDEMYSLNLPEHSPLDKAFKAFKAALTTAVNTDDAKAASPNPSEITLAVYVLARDASGAPSLLVSDITLERTAAENGEHYERAEDLAREQGYEWMASFDQNDPAGQCMLRSMCVELAPPAPGEAEAPPAPGA